MIFQQKQRTNARRTSCFRSFFLRNSFDRQKKKSCFFTFFFVCVHACMHLVPKTASLRIVDANTVVVQQCRRSYYSCRWRFFVFCALFGGSTRVRLRVLFMVVSLLSVFLRGDSNFVLPCSSETPCIVVGVDVVFRVTPLFIFL